MEKRWVVQENKDENAVSTLASALNIDEVLARLLVLRQVTTFEEARTFFRPELAHLHDPFLMKDMDRAITRIEKAMANNEGIMIFGDYDVDGTTAVAAVYSFFKKFYDNISYYIPDRYVEGYGISSQGIDVAAAQQQSLIIALDCGIKSVDKVAYATEKGIDFIICDHHMPGDELPAAVAVLDPKRDDCTYPYKELSGCGIGLKLVQAFLQKNHLAFDEAANLLDLVAVSIAADIVPITGENRALAYHGLQKINTDPSAGLKALMAIAGRNTRYTMTDVVFQLGPRINAAGRIGHGSHAVRLLITGDKDLADDHSLQINSHNSERKTFDKSITLEALAMINTDPASASRKSTVVFNESWHKGVIGIVASRLIENYYRPTIVLTESNGHVAGSARSVLNFDLYEALCGCSDLLEQFGGHKYAAGLTMKRENIPALVQRFEEVVSSTITDEQLIPQILIDAELELQQIDAKFYRILSQFAPFGPQNMSPVFVSAGVNLKMRPTIVGENHLKLTVAQGNSAAFECIGFGLANHYDELLNCGTFDICYSIEENVWKEKRILQLNLKGIRIPQ